MAANLQMTCSNAFFLNEIVWFFDSWWLHQMEAFSALLAICAGDSPVTCEFPAQRPVTRSFDAFFDLRLNKRLSKQSRGWWFETLSRPLWRHCNVVWLFGPIGGKPALVQDTNHYQTNDDHNVSRCMTSPSYIILTSVVRVCLMINFYLTKAWPYKII